MTASNNWFMFCLLLPLSNSLTPEQREEILRVHNWFRSAVVPQAADMNMLVYDTTREELAQKYAEKCIFEHGYEEPGGENLQLSGHNNFTWVIMDWFHERVYWNYTNQLCDQKNAPQNMDYMRTAQCGHYRMMVVARLTRVWCGSHLCEIAREYNNNTYENKYINVCRYDFGNRVDMYQSGEHCTGCSLKSAFCNKGLCIPCKGPECECRVNCKKCGSKVQKTCLCMCDGNGDPNKADCSGQQHFPNPTCGICEGLGESCLKGGVDVSNASDENSCKCKCPSGYSGKRCEYTPEMVQDASNGVRLLMRGERYRNGYAIYNPVNYYAFLEIWNDTLKPLLFAAIEKSCTPSTNCVDNRNADILNVNKIQSAWKTPILQEWGTLELIIFMKNGGLYLNKTIMSEAISNNIESINTILKVKLVAELFSVQPVSDSEFESLLPTTTAVMTTDASQNDDRNSWATIFAYCIIAIAVILCLIIIGTLLCVNYGPLSRRRYRNVNEDIPMKTVKT